MPRRQETYEGELVALVATEYPSFPNRETGEIVPGGTTHTAWLVTDPTDEPLSVKVPPEAYHEMQAVVGQTITLNVSLGAFANRLVYRYISWSE